MERQCDNESMIEPPFPEYQKPPVNEVVCGITFKPVEQLLTPYIGVLWEEYKSSYPRCQEAPPLLSLTETFGEGLTRNKPEFAEMPPLPRVWFLNSEGNGIIQVQRDRFLHNWRRLNDSDIYPRYERVFAMFLDHLQRFQAFLDKHHLGEIEAKQYEMTYVNHFYKDEGWTTTGDAGRLFRDFKWRDEERFLPHPEGLNWRCTFVLPNKTGRMHVSIQNAESRDDSRPLYALELTVRGMEGDGNLSGLHKWFDRAHEWIVRGFADLTDIEAQQQLWRRTK